MSVLFWAKCAFWLLVLCKWFITHSFKFVVHKPEINTHKNWNTSRQSTNYTARWPFKHILADICEEICFARIQTHSLLTAIFFLGRGLPYRDRWGPYRGLLQTILSCAGTGQNLKIQLSYFDPRTRSAKLLSMNSLGKLDFSIPISGHCVLRNAHSTL